MHMLDTVTLLTQACLHSPAVPQAALTAEPPLSLLLCLPGRSVLPLPTSSPIKLPMCMQSCCPDAACPRWQQQAGLPPPCWSRTPCTS